MKTPIESAIDAMNNETWTGYSVIELVKNGRITEESFDATAQKLLEQNQELFANEEMKITEILSLGKVFTEKCIEIMRINAGIIKL